MKLYSLYYGRKKSKISQLLMTDSKEKCENLRKARENNVAGFHEIKLAPPNSKTKAHKSSTIGGNSSTLVPRINKRGGVTINGYVDKDGFHPHT